MSGRGPRMLLPVLVLATTTAAVVSSLGAPLVPEVARTEHVSVADAQWTLTAALLSGAIAVPILGRLGTHRHRRPVLLVAIAAAVVGTLVAALPLGFAGILVGRTLQGVALGSTPVAIAIARAELPAARQASALSLLSVSVVAGAGLGYPVAALVATLWGLRAAYVFGVAVSGLAFVAAFLVVPRARDAEPEPRVDVLGAVVLSLGSGALLLAVTQGETWGWASLLLLGMLALAAVALVLFARRSLRLPNPLIDLRLAVRRGVLAANLVALVAGVGVYMLLSLVVVVVQAPRADGGLEQSVFVAGLLMVPYSIASLFGSRVNVVLARRIAPDLLLPIGCAFYAGALVLVAFAHSEVWTLALAMLLAGLGSGSSFAAMPGLVLRHAEPRESGSAVSANQLLRNFGFAAGSAATSAVLALFVLPGEVHADPAGFTVAGLVGAGILLVGMAVSLVLGLREVRAGRARPDPDEPEDPGALEI